MTWRIDDPQGNESAKIKYLIVPYTRGRGLDLGCGPFKAFPHFIGVDNGHHAKQFGWQMQPDIHVETCESLPLFASGSMDFVFSSHLLEHIHDTRKTLKEWWRVLRNGGYLVLYLPHKELYPNIGQPGANPDHKHDFLPADVIEHMRAVGDWDLVVNETRGDGFEYSFLQVYKKNTNGKCSLTCDHPKPERTACVVRYGGIGDLLQAATIAPSLKAEGYHVTMMTTPHGAELLAGNPHIDAFLVQDKDQVPNEELGPYWAAWEKKFDRFINLCEVVEGGLLAMPGRMSHNWSTAARQKILGSVNYYERMADIAGTPYDFGPSFFPSDIEKANAAKQRKAMPDGDVILWSLAGSSIHKAWPYTDIVVDRLMRDTDSTVVLVGDESCQLLEEAILEGVLFKHGVPEGLVMEAIKQDGLAGLEMLALRLFGRERILCRSGKWAVRDVLAFAAHCAVVVGPETGILSGVAYTPVAKVLMLSHSSPDNLCKHWVNTTALMAGVECQPCHRMHYGREFCPEHKETTAALCMGMLHPEAVYDAIRGRQPRVKLHAVSG